MSHSMILRFAALMLSIAAVFTITVTGAQQNWDTPPTSGFFYIQSVQAGTQNLGYWDQPGVNARFKQGANIAVYAKDNGADQRFRFVPAGNGSYEIVSQNGGYIDVAGGKDGDGINIQTWARNNSIAQKFRFRHLGNGRWKIFTQWNRVICLAARSHGNGSNIHTWGDHDGPWMEWHLIDSSKGTRYIPAPQTLSGKLEAVDYDTQGKASSVWPGRTEIEVWTFNPQDTKNLYQKKKSVWSNENGSFDLGTEFMTESTVFLISRSPDRASATTKFSPTQKESISGFVTEKHNARGYILINTDYRGKQYYYLDKGLFYLRNGIISNKADFFYPNLTRINRTAPASAKLLADLKAAPATTDADITARFESVFSLLRTKTKSYMGTDANAKAVSEELFSTCQVAPRSPLNRWPSFDEYAAIYAKHGFIPTGNCTSWTQLATTLLYAAGVPVDRIFTAKFNYDMSWLVEHWVIGVYINNRWYSVDPQHTTRTFKSPKDFDSAYHEKDRPGYDFKRPFEAFLLPGSSISRVPYLGDPKILETAIQAAARPSFFMDNSVFEYSSSTMVNTTTGTAVVKEIRDQVITIAVDAVTTGDLGDREGTMRSQFTLSLTHKGYNAYARDGAEGLKGQVDETGKSLYLSGMQSGIRLTVKSGAAPTIPVTKTAIANDILKAMYPDFKDCRINANDVIIRAKPDALSAVVAKATKGTRLTVTSPDSTAVFVKGYFGTWLGVTLTTGKKGYVLSSFVEAPSHRVEPFHVFFERFRSGWEKQQSTIFTHVETPLTCDESEEGTVNTSTIDKQNFFTKARIKGPHTYPMTFAAESADAITVRYGYEAQQYTLVFAIVEGQWRLMRIRVSMC
jgi:hypothetical protein